MHDHVHSEGDGEAGKEKPKEQFQDFPEFQLRYNLQNNKLFGRVERRKARPGRRL